MKDFEPFYIPRTLDEPDQVLFFQPDEFVLLMSWTAAGIVFDFFILGLLVGVGCFYLLKRMKGSEQPNWLLCATYWFLPQCFSKLKGTPPSYIRLFQG